jgi:hypothetical protein
MMDPALLPFVFAVLVVILIAGARFLRLLLFPDQTRHDLTFCKERIREMDYRIAEVLKELKAIRELLEARREHPPATGIRQGGD